MRASGWVLSIVVLGACGTGTSVPPCQTVTPGAGVTVDVVVPVASPGTATAEGRLRADVVAYGVPSYDRGQLDLFLRDHAPRVGDVLIDEINPALRGVQNVGEVRAALAPLRAVADKIVASGGRVQIILVCTTPQWLSKHPTLPHSVLTGRNEPNGEPIWGCAPPAPGRYAEWGQIVAEMVSEFADLGDRVYYVFGSEPGNYFAGTLDELLAQWQAFAEAARSVDPTVRLGGLTTVGLGTRLEKASPLLGGNDIVTFTAQVSGRSLLHEWIDFSAAQGIAFDFATLHLFNGGPFPMATASWNETRTSLDDWLATAAIDPAQVELLINDFPDWQVVLNVDAATGFRSAWDSEYGAAYFAHTTLTMLAASLQGRVVRTLRGYLLNLGLANLQLPQGVLSQAGFPNGLGLFGLAGIETASYRLATLITMADGLLAPASSSDEFVAAVAAVSPDGTSVDVVLSHHIPSEMFYVPPGGGYAGYQFGHIFRNSFGITPSGTDMPSPAMQAYLNDPTFPKSFIEDLLAEPQAVDLTTLGLVASTQELLRSARELGLRARARRHQPIQVVVDLDGIRPGVYRAQEFIVDASHSNPYEDRAALDGRLTPLLSDPPAFLREVERINDEYTLAPATRDVSLCVGQTALVLDMQPNAVHLLHLTRTGEPPQ